MFIANAPMKTISQATRLAFLPSTPNSLAISETSSFTPVCPTASNDDSAPHMIAIRIPLKILDFSFFFAITNLISIYTSFCRQCNANNCYTKTSNDIWKLWCLNSIFYL